jgi:hypothetical protein
VDLVWPRGGGGGGFSLYCLCLCSYQSYAGGVFPQGSFLYNIDMVPQLPIFEDGLTGKFDVTCSFYLSFYILEYVVR